MTLSPQAKVGALVLLASFAFAILSLLFGEFRPFMARGKEYQVVFKNVSGLSKGAEVRVAGIKAGRVRSLTLTEDGVLVSFEISGDVKLFKNASAQIGTLGLLGDKYLDIDPGSPSFGELSPSSRILITKESSDIDSLVREAIVTTKSLNALLEENRESLRLTLQNLQVLTKTLSEISEENRQNINLTIQNLTAITTALNKSLPKTLENIEKLTAQLEASASENRADIKETIANLKVISQELRSTLPELTKNLNALSVNLNQTLDQNRENISNITRSISEITQRIERGEGTIGKLLKDEEVYKNIVSGTRALRRAGDLAEQTNLYLGFATELYESGGTKGILSFKIQPNRDKYYLLEIVGDSRGSIKQQRVEDRQIIKREFRPEITAQYARSFHHMDRALTLRAGLKESSGGVGADLSFGSKLALSADLFDFGRKDLKGKDIRPNLQMSLRYRIYGPVFVRVGADEILNKNLRGPYGSAGVLFTDNDLKYLLGTLRLPLP
ncbi:MAG: MlaD family protein [Aquificaceae bacterium]